VYRSSNSTHFREISWHFTLIFCASLHNQADYEGITQMSNYLGWTRKPSNYRLAMPINVCLFHNNDSADCSLACLSILNVISKSIYIINDYMSCSRSAVCQQQMLICDIHFLTAVSPVPVIQIFWEVTPFLWVALHPQVSKRPRIEPVILYYRADSCVSSALYLHSGAHWMNRLEHRLSILVRPRRYQDITWNQFNIAT